MSEELPRTVVQVLDFPARRLRRELGEVGPYLLGLTFLSSVPAWIAQPLTQQYAFTPGELPPLTFLLAYPVLFVAFLIQMATMLMMYQAARLRLDGESLSLGKLWSVVRPSTWGTLLLQMLVFAFTYTCCLFLPGLLWQVLTSLTVPVILVEGLVGIPALKRAISLSQQQLGTSPVWVNLLTLNVVVMFLTFGVAGFAIVPQALWMVFSVMRDASSGASIEDLFRMPWYIQLPSNFLVMLGSVLSTGYAAFGMLLLHRSVLRESDGDDLEAAIGARTT